MAVPVATGRYRGHFVHRFVFFPSFFLCNLPVGIPSQSLQSCRSHFNAEAVADLHDSGIDDLPFVIWEKCELPFNQQFHVFEDVGKIGRRSGGIESQVSLPVLVKLPLSNEGMEEAKAALATVEEIGKAKA